MSESKIEVRKDEYLSFEMPLDLLYGVGSRDDYPISIKLVSLIPFGVRVSIVDGDTYSFEWDGGDSGFSDIVTKYLEHWKRGASFRDEIQGLPHNPQAPHPTISISNYPIQYQGGEENGLSLTVLVGDKGVGALLDYSAVEKLEAAITKYKSLVA